MSKSAAILWMMPMNGNLKLLQVSTEEKSSSHEVQESPRRIINYSEYFILDHRRRFAHKNWLIDGWRWWEAIYIS